MSGWRRPGRLACRGVVLCGAALAVGAAWSGAAGADDGLLAVVCERIVLRQPHRRLCWTDGERVTIAWRDTLLADEPLEIRASFDAGLTWRTLGRRPASAGRFSFVPAEAPADAVLRLRTADGRVKSNRVRVHIAPRMLETAFSVGFALSRHSDGTLRTWGQYPPGMGEPYTFLRTAQPIAGFGDVRSLAAGGDHALAVRTDGTVVIWGDPDGALAPGLPVAVPQLIPGIEHALFARAEYATSFVRLDDGRVLAWGHNISGNLGDGTDEPRDVPTEIPALFGVLDIALGRAHGVALAPDGTVLSWGRNNAGQGGDGTYADSFLPRAVQGITTAVQVAARLDWAMALLADGSVLTWGSNSFQQLGRVTDGSDPRPGRIGALTDIAFVACGSRSGYAIDQRGALHAWGSNGSGQVGDGTRIGRDTPVRVHLSDVREIFCGNATVHAIDALGRRFAWGSNVFFQVGDGSLRSRPTPRRLYVR